MCVEICVFDVVGIGGCLWGDYLVFICEDVGYDFMVWVVVFGLYMIDCVCEMNVVVVVC